MRRPDWGMLLEEGGVIEGDPSKPRWIVDPLDGTDQLPPRRPAFLDLDRGRGAASGGEGRDHATAWSTSR